jgi:hypothetical protein
VSAWCLWQHRKVLKRNRTDARAVYGLGRSNGFSPDPIVRLRNPGFPHRGFFASASLAGRLHICIPIVPTHLATQRSWALDTHAREVSLFDVPRIPALNLRRAE